MDGLRAVAVLAIIAFHLNVPGFDAGFLGVDVFFVISGYVISRGMLREVGAGRFSLVEFYVRRARRILPALLAVLAMTLLAGIMLLSPDEITELSASAFATLAFAANFYFHDRTGYFADAAHYRPLLHMWSLGVEEQFYILFPPLLLVSFRHRAKVLAILGVASFAYLLIAYPMSQKNAFYMPMARFWELAVGCGIAMMEEKGWCGPGRTLWLAAVGLLGIITSVCLGDSASIAGWTMALPVLAAGMVVAFGGTSAGMVHQLLASRPLVTIGLLSYSMYLVHWPLIVFWRMFTARPLTAPEQGLIFVLIMAMAALLWTCVEKPLRLGTSRLANKPALIGVGASVCAVIIVGFIGRTQAAAPWRLSADALSSVTQLRRALADRPSCVADPGFLRLEHAVSEACRWNGSSRSTEFVLWGDSHAAAIAPELSRALPESLVHGVRVTMPDCPPLQGVRVVGRTINKQCREFVDALVAAVHRERPRLVIVAGRWATLASDVPSPGDGLSSGHLFDLKTDRPMTLKEALVRTLDALALAGSHVVLIGPIPEIEYHVARTLVRSLRGIGALPSVPRSQFDIRQAQVLSALADIEVSGQFTVVYPHKVLCSDTVCSVAEGVLPLYVDDDHLSPFGATKVAKQVADAIGR